MVADHRVVHLEVSWHWHGYKPEDVQCWIDAMRDDTWPKRSWREQGGDACYVTTKAGNRILRGACSRALSTAART